MRALHTLLLDERGGEVLEYTLVAGMIIIAAVFVVATIRDQILAR
jgi:Flp pilus assembly pilin Flp